MKKIIILFLISVLVFSLSVNANELPSKKLSFKFNNLPLKNVFNLLSQASNINILYTANTEKKISLSFDNVLFKEIIDTLAKTNNLDYVYRNDILIVDQKNVIKELYKNNDDKIKIGGKNSKSQIIHSSKPSNSSSIIVSQPKEEKEKNFDNVKGITKGTLLPAKLQLGLISSSKKSKAIVKVSKNINYEGKTIIPKGSVFTGYGVSDYGVRKIFVKLDTLIIGNREIDVTAHLVKENGQPGFLSEYRDLSMENFWPKFFAGFLSDIAGSLKDVTYIENGQPVEKNSVKNKVLENTQNGIDNWTEQVKSDAEKHQAIMTVNAGIKGYIFIDKKIPLNRFKEYPKKQEE